MDKILIKNAHIVSDGKILLGDVYIESGIIKEVADHISANLQMEMFSMQKEITFCQEL